MANMSLDEIIAAIEAAEPKDKLALAEKLMNAYSGDDKDVVEGDILSMAIVTSEFNF